MRLNLELRPGNSVVFNVNENREVFIRKAPSIDVEFLQALEDTLTEWFSKNNAAEHKNL